MMDFWRGLWRKRRERREREALDALKIRYHTFRILLANNERALARLAAVESGLADNLSSGELIGLVEDLQAVTFEMVDGVARLAPEPGAELYARHLRLEEALREALEGLDDAGRPPSCLSLSRPLRLEDVGGKAAGVSLLTRNGFPVPDGFAVTVRACREFLHEAGLDETIRRALRSAPDTESGLAEACRDIRREMLAAVLPDWLRQDLTEAVARLRTTDGGDAPLALAARSSALTEDRAEHSFAGQFVSRLNLTSETLEQGFLEVMAGAFTERAVTYRQEAGIPPATLDMAVLVQVMVPAVAAGVLFTVDPVRPESGRMLISAVPGLGVLAVDGAVPVDVYRVDRDDPTDVVAQLARKTRRAVSDPKGGIRRETVPHDERDRQVLSEAMLSRLARTGLAAEALSGSCRDMEYAVDAAGRLWLLQSRPARISWEGHRPPPPPRELFQGGQTGSPGRTLGRIRHVATLTGQTPAGTGAVVAVLPSAAPEAAAWMSRWRGVVVETGNPADHLSTVAREMGRPMLTGAVGASAALPEDALVVLDAGQVRVTQAPAAIGDLGTLLLAAPVVETCTASVLSPDRARLRDLIVPLTLVRDTGPTFSLESCHTVHDVIRFAHETAVLALLETGSSLADGAVSTARPLGEADSLELMVIDLGGGLDAEASDTGPLTPRAVLSMPLAALWRGLAPGAAPAGSEAAAGAMSEPRRGYALASRDYVNCNLRFHSHFAMVDAVCGPRPRGNYVRVRLKSGEADPARRRRGAICLEQLLGRAGFCVNRQGGLVSGALTETTSGLAAETLELVGRLLGHVLDLDVAMTDDAAPFRLAEDLWTSLNCASKADVSSS